MGWLSVAVGVVAAIVLYQSQAGVLFWIAVAATVLALWSWGVMHNFAIEAAKQRVSFKGGFYDITPEEADAAPNWVTTINFLTTVGCMVLLAVGLYRIF